MITITDIDSIIQQLSHVRPIFHSEADFQHALAWLIHQRYPDCRVRLEVNPYKDDRRAYLDILLQIDDITVAMELKYKTRKLDLGYGEEDFHLLDQSAQDTGRYDFIKDIGRLERFVFTHKKTLGFAIFLSNDRSYWQAAKRQTTTVDEQFRIHENKVLEGRLQWSELASVGTRRGREKELVLTDEYPLLWHEYSQLSGTKSGQFRYLLLAVRS